MRRFIASFARRFRELCYGYRGVSRRVIQRRREARMGLRGRELGRHGRACPGHPRRASGNRVEKVHPCRIAANYETNLPVSGPMLDVVFVLNCGLDVIELLEIHQPLDGVALGEAEYEPFAMFMCTTDEIIGHSDMQHAVWRASQNVNVASLGLRMFTGVDGRDKPGHDGQI